MNGRFGAVALSLVLLATVTAGCATDAPDSVSPTANTTSTTTSTSTSTSTVSTVAVTNDTAKQEAIRAETDRIREQLRGEAISSVSVGVMGDVEATVLNRSEDGVRVSLRVPYSYEYNCTDAQGHVDALTTQTTYLVTGDSTKVVEVTEDVRRPC